MKPTDQFRPSSRRGASVTWNRLKPTRDDTLETYGLPSKGETRLNDFKTQETYLNRIVEYYMKFCAASPNSKELGAHFAAVNIQSTSIKPPAPPSDILTNKESLPVPNSSVSPNNELPRILNALRKLREAITATRRHDQWAQRAYIFNINVSILCRDWESYLPALTTLLYSIHPKIPLAPTDVHDFVGYLILDQACRQDDPATAYETLVKWGYSDRRVEMLLKAKVSDNWVMFWRMKRAVDGYQRRIIEYSENAVRLHALKCIGRAYMRVDKAYLERCTGRKWEDLVKDGVGWELTKDDKVIIKKPKST